MTLTACYLDRRWQSKIIYTKRIDQLHVQQIGTVSRLRELTLPAAVTVSARAGPERPVPPSSADTRQFSRHRRHPALSLFSVKQHTLT